MTSETRARSRPPQTPPSSGIQQHRTPTSGHPYLLTASEVAAVKQQAEAQVPRIAAKISRTIGRYGGPESGPRRDLITLAVRGSLKQFIQSLGPRPLKPDGLTDLFRHMAHGEAIEGHDRTALWGAIAIAHAEATHWLTDTVVTLHLPASCTREISRRARAFIGILLAEIDAGYERGLFEVAPSRLCQALIERADVQPFADLVGWTPPDRVVVLNAQSRRPTEWPCPASTPVMTGPTAATYVVAPDDLDVLTEILSDLPDARIAVSWPVSIPSVQDADRWTRTALELAARRVIPRRSVIYCDRHRVDLWAAADNALRIEMERAVLRPLLRQTPKSKAALSETLLLWLQTHGSAPELGERLGTHSQTVRYRWRRITELFGDRLADPEAETELLLALRANLPLWRVDPPTRPLRRT